MGWVIVKVGELSAHDGPQTAMNASRHIPTVKEKHEESLFLAKFNTSKLLSGHHDLLVILMKSPTNIPMANAYKMPEKAVPKSSAPVPANEPCDTVITCSLEQSTVDPHEGNCSITAPDATISENPIYTETDV